MKIKILSLLFAIVGLFALFSCDGTTKVYSDNFNFVLNADCSKEGLTKITSLYKTKGLLVGDKLTVSIIVDIKSNDEDNKLALRNKVIDILKLSSTRIYTGEFHALNTGATMTIYSAYYTIDNAPIDTVVTNFGKLP